VDEPPVKEQREINRLLKAHCKFARTSGDSHELWRLPNGHLFTLPRAHGQRGQSDHRAVKNNLRDLRIALGLSSRGFEHKPQEPKKPKPLTRKRRQALAQKGEREAKEFLSGHAPVHQPTAPEAPLTAAAPLPEFAKDTLPEDSASIPTASHLLVKPKGVGVKRHVIQRPSARSGRTRTFAPEIMAQANYLLQTEGEQAMKHYLDSISLEEDMGTLATHPGGNGAALEHSETTGAASTPPPDIGIGPIQAALKDAEAKAKHFHAEEVRCHAEASRWDQIAAGLRNTLQLTTAARSQFAEAAPNGGNSTTTAPMAKGQWTIYIREALKSGPLTTAELRNKIKAAHPEVTTQSLYSSYGNEKKRGRIIERDGLLMLPEQAQALGT
jgi:hypothetical protein